MYDIEERLRKGDATNIALTGPYGSGKSSILLTLKEDFPDYNYLNISLATLKPAKNFGKGDPSGIDEDGDNELPKQNLDRLIEYSILQQLIYKEKQKTLPNSRFKRIFHLPKELVLKVTIAIIIAFIAWIVVWEPSFFTIGWLCDLFSKEWMNISGDVLCLGYLLWFVYKAIAMIVPAISNSRLNKLNLKDGEIEIVENTSIFNKHLDEILYFFEQTDYNVVMLEDLDRFESIDIFLKLRELNLLLNESKVISRKIFFIYAVRDDMFQDSERVKCFDYITTVIPVINRSNAKDQLKEELKKRGVTEIKDVTLRELGFFLYDMRLLKNIANEYVQYRGKLEKGISADKLLGMIVYKNFYPNDFADLHDCKGMVYQLLNLKETLIADKIEALEEDNRRRNELRERHQQERHLKETELRRIYLEGYRDRLGSTVQYIKIGDSNYSVKDIAANEKLFDSLIANRTIWYTFIDANGYYGGRPLQGSTDISFDIIENLVDPTQTYHQRLNSLRATFEELADHSINNISKDDIRSQTLSQVLSSIDYGAIKEYQSLNVPRLIEFLVVKGYIDENYYDYISYFYANFIDAHDWDFVLDLKLNRPHPYEYHINNVEAFLTEIPKGTYRKNAILNIDLVDYLATNLSDRMNMTRLLVIIKTAVEGKKYDFFAAYYKIGKKQSEVFGQLFNQYKDLWNAFEKYDDDKSSLKLSWFKYAEAELSCEGSKKWLGEHFAFITDHFLDIEIEQWCKLIRNGEYQFEELNTVSDDVLKTVADTNSFTLTKHNLGVIVGRLLDMNLDSVSYSLVNQTDNKALIKRVDKNLGLCLTSVFSAPESEKEKTDAIRRILLSEEVTEEVKIEYLRRQQNRIDFEEVEQNDVKTLALKCDVIEPSWENVIHYMKNVCDQNTDTELVRYIDRYADVMAKQVIPSDDKESERMLHTQLIGTDVLLFETYVKIIDRFRRWSFVNGVPAIEERRMSLLIEKGMVYYTEENTKGLSDGYSPKVVVAYLLKNKRDFLASPDSMTYTTAVATGLMEADLTVREKATIIPYFGIEIVDANLADEIIHILSMQEITLEKGFLLTVMKLTRLSGKRLKVLSNILMKNSYDDNVITAFIETLPFPYKSIAEKGRKPEIPSDLDSWQLVKVLKDKDYISSYSATKKGIRVNTKLK